MALTIRWIMYEKPETHTRLLRHVEAFCVWGRECFAFVFSIWLWQDIFILTSTVSYFLECTIPFGCFPMLAGLYHNQNQRCASFLLSICALFNELKAHTHINIFKFSNRIFDFEWNSYEIGDRILSMYFFSFMCNVLYSYYCFALVNLVCTMRCSCQCASCYHFTSMIVF